MKGKFKFNQEERDLLRNSLADFKNDVIKDSVDNICGAEFSRSFSRVWGRVIIIEEVQ